MVENWRPVFGFDGYYRVSDLGHLKRMPRMIKHWRGGVRLWPGRLISGSPNRDGYLSTSLSRDGVSRSTFIHIIVAENFCPNPKNLPEVEHKDRNRANNRADNLEWISQADNVAKGERVKGSKLKPEDVLDIRGMILDGIKQNVIAEIYGVDPSAISSIKTKRNWKHI